MATSGQTINDRLNAVRYALAGQGLARTVCKATTEEVLGPKKKHMDYLLACTEEPNVSIPQMANLLIDRSQHSSWSVVFKSMITIHHLMNYGNERFTQYLATSNHSFELSDFMDRTTPQGYSMSTYVRRYAKYINDKISTYKTLAIDPCKIKLGRENALRTMNMDKLSKTLPVVHTQFDSLLEFNVEAKELNNGIIMAAFKLIYKDLNRIFAAYQEAIINLVERYFNLSRKRTREALTMYKKYLDRMDKVANFFRVVEEAGLDKNEMPDTSKLTSLLAVFEEHLAQLEAKKRGGAATPASPDGATESRIATKTAEASQSVTVEGSGGGACQPAASKEDGSPGQVSAEKFDEKSSKSDEDTAKPKPGPSPPPPPQPPASGSGVASQQMAPKKPPPARPCPAKVSPQSESSKPPALEAEKKSPPKRPAKPPSRPPPPSSAASPPSVTPSGSVSPATAAETPVKSPSNQIASHTSQNHENPPENYTARDSQLPESEATGAKIVTPTEQEPAKEESNNQTLDWNRVDDQQLQPIVDGDASINGDESSTGSSMPTCSAVASALASGARGEDHLIGEDGTMQSNHVSINNVDSNHIDDAHDSQPPSPPPPPDIDESEPGEQEENANENHQLSTNNGADSNSDPPPPPPLPIEDQ